MVTSVIEKKMKLDENCCRFTNLKVKDGLTELSLPKIQTDMLKDYDRQVVFPIIGRSFSQLTQRQRGDSCSHVLAQYWVIRFAT